MPLPTLEQIEELNRKAVEFRIVETALDRLDRAIDPAHETIITSIEAHDNANGHRSIILDFTPEEGVAIFETAKQVLTERLEQLKADLGVD